MDFAQEVYDALTGERTRPIIGVGNAFEEGKPCAAWYAQMLAAYDRLRERLAVTDEDVDVETIIDSLLMIQRELCTEMFRLGRKVEQNGVQII